MVNCKKKIYQRCPVCIQISDFERWHKLGTSYNQKVEIEEELELLVENLREKHKMTVKRLFDLSVEQGTLKKWTGNVIVHTKRWNKINAAMIIVLFKIWFHLAQ